MKKPYRLGLFFGAVLAVFVYLLAETVLVKIKTADVRSEPKFYATSLATISAGTSLQKITEKDGWIQVKTASGTTGWIHSSAVATKKFDLMAMDKNMKTQASSNEVALAGKGFNKQVETKYRARHGEVNYAAVDIMERFKVTPAAIEEFLKNGRLGEFGGAR